MVHIYAYESTGTYICGIIVVEKIKTESDSLCFCQIHHDQEKKCQNKLYASLWAKGDHF